MKGDFTRFRFDPATHRRRVYTQQGRVSVDSDANEGVDVAEYLREVGIVDVVGPSGGPLSGAGFAITAPGGVLTIGSGHYWVDGLLVENDASTTVAAQPYLPAGVSPVSKADGTPGAAPTDGVYVVFLDTWERLLTAVEDDSLREPALGGPDTTTRTQQVWQVRLLRAGNLGTTFSCSSNLAAWNTLVGAPGVTMAARSAVSTTPPDDCTVPASAGYRGTENQHYRVEIHDPGAVGTATFVWSRENGSVVTSWTGRTGDNLDVSSPGRDGSLGFAPGDWVELIDETRELSGGAGTLVQLLDARGDRLVVDPATATGTLDRAQFPRNPRVRRWDSDGPQTVSVPGTNSGWLELELGVQIHWPSSGTFKTGQWWAVPARTVLGDVIWPDPGGVPSALAPFGERHHFARLAVAQLQGGAWTVLGDCRMLFPPLTGLESLFALGGDGQEAVPDVANPATLVALPAQLRVGVANGKTPVANAPVRFRVTTGGGTVNGANTIVVPTGNDGVASVSWSVDSANALQTVTAQLIDDLGTPLHLPVQFDATLSTATEVAYDPAKCAELAGTKTVQQAIDTLCTIAGEGCATIVLTPGENWQAPLVQLVEGNDARICFRPGLYQTSEPVVVSGMGNLVVSGCGPGSRVFAPQSEVALLFQDCDDVLVQDLAFESGVVGTTPERPGLNGALTLESCRTVTLERVTATCAAGTGRAAACIAVRAGEFPVHVARIRDCDLRVGHMQVGALVLDAETAFVSGTTVRVTPRPETLTFAALLHDARRRGLLARQLFGRARAIDPAREVSGFNTKLKVAGYTVAFDSPVPQTEWSRLAAQHPPAEADLASKEALQNWVGNLASQAVSNPQALPSFARHVQTLQRQLGEQFGQVAHSDVGRTLLHSTLVVGPVMVAAPGATRAAGEQVLTIGNSSVRFESVLSTDDWRLLLRGSPEVASGAQLKRQMATLAAQALTNADLRQRVPALGAWWQGLVRRDTAVASAGIVVAGKTADSVVVEDNDLVGVEEAVHVGLSAGGLKKPGSTRSAGSVAIRGNRSVMRVPFELEYGARAFFVGNAQHAAIVDNHMQMDVGAEGVPSGSFLEGIRVWGTLGPLVRVADNLLRGCHAGVRIRPQPGTPQNTRWDASGNVAPDAQAAVVAPATVSRSANVP